MPVAQCTPNCLKTIVSGYCMVCCITCPRRASWLRGCVLSASNAHNPICTYVGPAPVLCPLHPLTPQSRRLRSLWASWTVLPATHQHQPRMQISQTQPLSCLHCILAQPALGEQAAQESVGELGRVVAGADLLFITAGMGGGTGTGAAPVIARLAKDAGRVSNVARRAGSVMYRVHQALQLCYHMAGRQRKVLFGARPASLRAPPHRSVALCAACTLLSQQDLHHTQPCRLPTHR